MAVGTWSSLKDISLSKLKVGSECENILAVDP